MRERLSSLFATAQSIGAIGPGPISNHLEHSAAFVALIGELAPSTAAVLDLGSGAGLPGLVISVEAPALALTLLDGRVERAKWLASAVESLDRLGSVEVIGERAEVAGRKAAYRGAFDVVVARAFASPAVTAECAAPFLRTGGLLICSEPPDATPGERWDGPGCAQLGLQLERTTSEPYSFAILRQVAPCPERYPRRTGIPSKRPLF